MVKNKNVTMAFKTGEMARAPTLSALTHINTSTL